MLASGVLQSDKYVVQSRRDGINSFIWSCVFEDGHSDGWFDHSDDLWSYFEPWTLLWHGLPSLLSRISVSSCCHLLRLLQWKTTQEAEWLALAERIYSKRGDWRKVYNGSNQIFQTSLLGSDCYCDPWILHIYSLLLEWKSHDQRTLLILCCRSWAADGSCRFYHDYLSSHHWLCVWHSKQARLPTNACYKHLDILPPFLYSDAKLWLMLLSSDPFNWSSNGLWNFHHCNLACSKTVHRWIEQGTFYWNHYGPSECGLCNLSFAHWLHLGPLPWLHDWLHSSQFGYDDIPLSGSDDLDNLVDQRNRSPQSLKSSS